jgi:hypothetical protein
LAAALAWPRVTRDSTLKHSKQPGGFPALPGVHHRDTLAADPSCLGGTPVSTLEQSTKNGGFPALLGVHPGVTLASNPACTEMLVNGRFKRDHEKMKT